MGKYGQVIQLNLSEKYSYTDLKFLNKLIGMELIVL